MEGLVPFAGVGHSLADAFGLSDNKSREARFGLAIGQIVGGVITTNGGIGGEVLGGAATVTGVGAALGVPVMVVSTVAVAGGIGNIAAGIRGLASVMSGEGGTGVPPAGTAVKGGWSAPKITVNRHGQLTNGKYTIDTTGMKPHKIGSLANGKSQWLSGVDAEKAVLDAAAKADADGIWVGSKAKVLANKEVGALGSTGELTRYINVYRTNTGFVHGSPGSAP